LRHGIFGASGDLTKCKLIPAVYNLAKDNLLSRDFALVGFARPEMSHEQFRDKCTEEVKQFARIDGFGRRARDFQLSLRRRLVLLRFLK
jgi:glucose-6-phosphate 1-dehydrogenase